MSPPTLNVSTIWPTHGSTLGSRTLPRFVALRGTSYVVPARFAVSFEDPRLLYDVELEIAVDEDRGPRCTQLIVHDRPDGAEVTTQGLREIPLASLVEQGARFMAHEVVVGENGAVTYSPARMTEEGRAKVQKAWRFARAAPRSRQTFPATNANLKRVASFVEEALAMAAEEGRRPTVYADVVAALLAEGVSVSRATVQRRIEKAQEMGFARRWTEGSR